MKTLAGRLIGEVQRKVMGIVTSVETRETVAALTFDDGPHPVYTPRLLELLESHGARASFFMLGRAAAEHPEIVRRAANEGHAVCNHSYDHPSFPGIPSPQRRTQITSCAAALRPHGRRFFRPPYGHQSKVSRFEALLLRHEVIGWNLDSEDWRGHEPTRIAGKVLQKIQPGCIILFHDALHGPAEPSHADRQPTIEAVDMLLRALTGRYRFLTVPELLECGPPHRSLWFHGLSTGDAA